MRQLAGELEAWTGGAYPKIRGRRLEVRGQQRTKKGFMQLFWQGIKGESSEDGGQQGDAVMGRNGETEIRSRSSEIRGQKLNGLNKIIDFENSNDLN